MNIKSNTAILAVALVVGIAFAGGSAALAAAAGKTHDMTVQIVAVDKQSKTITIKDDKGATKAVPVLGNAARSLGNVRTGQMYTLSCQDDEKGEHQGITAINKAAKPAAK
jgi:hypothetical protein